ncbi:MAG: AraC family transcriptional regulator [Balneolaceae bacterium]|nr:AraC family transcriptional regulator [Balneolaceae bacterium]
MTRFSYRMCNHSSNILHLSPTRYRELYYGPDDRNTVHNGSRVTSRYLEIHRREHLEPHIDAHRLDFYLVTLVTGGAGIYTFGEEQYCVAENHLCFAGPDMVTAWRSEQQPHAGYLVTFSGDFFHTGYTNKRYLEQLPFFRVGGAPVLQLDQEHVAFYRDQCEKLYREWTQTQRSEDLLRSLLHVITDKARAQFETNLCSSPEPDNAKIRLTEAFRKQYLHDFEPMRDHAPVRIKKVSEYAEKLGVTQNYLNDTVKAVTGKSAGQLIREERIKRATICLKHSTLDIAEIAYRLGYQDPSYFTRY